MNLIITWVDKDQNGMPEIHQHIMPEQMTLADAVKIKEIIQRLTNERNDLLAYCTTMRERHFAARATLLDTLDIMAGIGKPHD